MTGIEWFYLLIGVATGTFAVLLTSLINKWCYRYGVYKYVKKDDTVFENSYVLVDLNKLNEVSWICNGYVYILKLDTTSGKPAIKTKE